MDNIFQNAYFGKTYKTRDGRKAIYCGTNWIEHILIIENKYSWVTYSNNGHYSNGAINKKFPEDIVSEWQEKTTPEDIDSLINVAKEIAIEQKCTSDFNKQKKNRRGLQGGFILLILSNS